MWNPADLLTDLDLLALDRACLTDFGTTSLADKRRVAADWVAQRVEQAGYTLHQHQIRKAPAAVFGYNGATYTDYTDAALDTTDADIPLSSICAVPSSAAVFVGYHAPFKGVYAGLADNVNANTATLAASVWAGAWTAVTSLQDGTLAVASKSLSGGGLVAWQQPDQWGRRTVNNSLLYWARLTVSSSLTAGTATGQLTPIVPSRLTLPASQYALALLYQESYGSNRGQWAEKAERMFKAAEDSLAVAIPLIADEFDVDDDGAVSGAEASSVTAAGNYAIWERG